MNGLPHGLSNAPCGILHISNDAIRCALIGKVLIAGEIAYAFFDAPATEPSLPSACFLVPQAKVLRAASVNPS